MPQYIYKHPEKEEYIEITQSMKEEHVYFDEDNIKWNRVLTSPRLNTEATIDPWSKNDFMNATANSKGTYGDLLDRSKEMSQKRADQNGGVDPIQQKYFKKYSQERGGQKHFADLPKSFENKNIKVDL